MSEHTQTVRASVPSLQGKKLSALKLLGYFLAPYKGLVALTIVALLFDMFGMLFVPTELSAMINAAVSLDASQQLMTHGIYMLIAAFAGSGGAIASNYCAAKLSSHVGRDIRVAIYDASLAYSGSDFEQFGTGSMVTRTLSDANVIQQTLMMSIIMILPVPVMSIIAVALAFSIDAWMGWVLLIVTVAVFMVSAIAVVCASPIFIRLQGFIDRMNVRLRESITGVRVIRAFCKEHEAREQLDGTFQDYATNAISVNYMFATADSMTLFLMNGVESLIMWLGANRVGVYAMQIGSITALIEYAMLILFFMMMAQFAFLQVPRAFACLARTGEVLSVQPEITDPVALEPVAEHHDATVATFDNVSFRFNDADEDMLHNLKFSLMRGQTTAIIGNTGSGKSTIAKLLLRFHDLTSGELDFEGTDIRKLTQDYLRSHIAFVPQKAWLFSGTIAENLRYGDENASDEALWHALDVAQADFVRELPDGLATCVAQGGTNFSGGQRQRLAIARALVRKADLYIFDDSFSALDYKTDADLRRALKSELTQAAVLIVGQRVSTIHDAAQIVVLKDGKIVGLGKHTELLKNCPTYRAIADSQTRKEENHE